MASLPEPGFGNNQWTYSTDEIVDSHIHPSVSYFGPSNKNNSNWRWLDTTEFLSAPMDTVRVKSPSLLSNPLKSWESRNSVEVRLAKHHFEEDKFNQRQRTKRRLPPTEKWETWKYLCFSNRKACKHYPPAPTTYVE